MNPLPRQSGVAKFAPVADAFEHPQREAARRALEHDQRGKERAGTGVQTHFPGCRRQHGQAGQRASQKRVLTQSCSARDVRAARIPLLALRAWMKSDSHASPTRERGNPFCISNKTAAILESTDGTRNCCVEQDWSCRRFSYLPDVSVKSAVLRPGLISTSRSVFEL